VRELEVEILNPRAAHLEPWIDMRRNARQKPEQRARIGVDSSHMCAARERGGGRDALAAPDIQAVVARIARTDHELQ
jgi:hypothetical protein